MKESICKQISENRTKALNKFLADKKKALPVGTAAPHPPQDQTTLWKEEFETLKGENYNKQCEEWKLQGLPKYFLAFVFCGLAGKIFRH
jgi:hypothetical protein